MTKQLKYIIIGLFLFSFLYSRAQTWNPVGSGYFGIPSGSTVQSFKVIDNLLYVGGGFNTTGTIAATGIAVWDGIIWDSLGSGTAYVYSIEKYNNEIYVGTNSTFIPLARWNGNNWTGVGNKKPNGSVYTLKYKNELYLGGNFYSLEDSFGNQTNVRHIAKWNGSNWGIVGGGVGGGIPDVFEMTEYNGDLIAAGWFACTGPLGNCDLAGQNIARWTGTQWFPLDSGVNETVYALEVDTVNNILYAWGNFNRSLGTNYIYMWFIGEWDGTKWRALEGDTFLPYAGVTTLCVYNGYLYVGLVDVTGTESDTVLVRWNKKQWEKVQGPGSSIAALTVYQNDLYVGGYFQTVNGDSSMRFLARFNTPNYCDSVNTAFTITSDTLYLSDSAMVQAVPSGFSNQYQWDFGDSTETDTAKFTTHYFSKDGVYTIKLKSTFGFCPWDSLEKTVVVVNDVGINEQKNSESKLKIYPNPADGSFTVEIQNSSFAIQNSSFKIYDVKGKLVKQMAINSKQMTIETKGWGKGVYFVKLIAGGKIVAKEKVILE